MAKTIIGVMGPGDGATELDKANAEELGRRIAAQGWVLLTGGRDVGVMDAASKGAHQADGLTIGILPTEHKTGVSPHVDIPICTGIGSARNNINVLSSDAIIACGSGAGTTSEIMLAIKAEKPIVLLNPSESLLSFIEQLAHPRPKVAQTPQQAIEYVHELV